MPRSLPGLLRAYELSARAATVGFDWVNATDVLDKLDEEVHEIREAVSSGHAGHLSPLEDEVGDLLFAVANLSRKLGIEPESALRRANEKFTRRFDAMEQRVEARGEALTALSLTELESEWQQVKVELQSTSDVQQSS